MLNRLKDIKETLCAAVYEQSKLSVLWPVTNALNRVSGTLKMTSTFNVFAKELLCFVIRKNWQLVFSSCVGNHKSWI